MKLWNHPAGKLKFHFCLNSALTPILGPKTIHFWAPMFKWGLVIAGLADINRPVEKVSLFQSSGKKQKIIVLVITDAL